MAKRVAVGVVCLLGAAAFVGCQSPQSVQSMEQAAAAGSPLTGKPAPDFTLPDQDAKPVTLSKLPGRWVVVYFYPKDDTPGCACQATEFTSLLTQFGDMNALVLGISPDSPASHRKFVEKYGLKLTLLSDPEHKVMTPYGAWVEAYYRSQKYGRLVRSTLIIDPKGVIRYHWPEVIPQGHADRVRQKLAALQKADRAAK